MDDERHLEVALDLGPPGSVRQGVGMKIAVRLESTMVTVPANRLQISRNVVEPAATENPRE